MGNESEIKIAKANPKIKNYFLGHIRAIGNFPIQFSPKPTDETS